MTKAITRSILASVTVIVSSINLHAQINNRVLGPAGNEGIGDLVTVDNMSVKILNLFTMDSVRSPHIASFELELNSSDDSKKILMSLLSAVQANQPVKLTLSRLGSQNQIIEEKNYKSVLVSEILFPDLNGASKDAAKFRVKIQAQDVTVRTDINEPAKFTPPGRPTINSNFKFVIGNLPAQRVVAISNLRVSNPSNGFVNFTVDVQRIDSKQWKDWFVTGAGGIRREKAVISLMEPNFTTELASIQLSEVEIVSISEFDASSGIPKTTIGLRARKIDMSK